MRSRAERRVCCAHRVACSDEPACRRIASQANADEIWCSAHDESWEAQLCRCREDKQRGKAGRSQSHPLPQQSLTIDCVPRRRCSLWSGPSVVESLVPSGPAGKEARLLSSDPDPISTPRRVALVEVHFAFAADTGCARAPQCTAGWLVIRARACSRGPSEAESCRCRCERIRGSGDREPGRCNGAAGKPHSAPFHGGATIGWRTAWRTRLAGSGCRAHLRR